MKLNVSNIINFDHIEIFRYYSIIAFLISTVFQIFYCYIIITCTNKKMRFFRYLMLTYIFHCFLAELTFFCWKPIRLLPFTILYCAGIVSSMNSTFSAAFLVILIYSFAVLMDCLTAIILERHFQICHIINPKVSYIRFWAFLFMILTLIFAVTASFNFTFLNVNDAEARKVLVENVQNAQIILDVQPSLLIFEHAWDIKTLLLIIAAALYLIYRIFIILWLIFENVRYAKKTSWKFSAQTREQFNLMLKSTIAQFVTTLTFGVPCTIWLLSCLFPSINSSMMLLYLLIVGFCLLYPIVDVIVVLSFVSPYQVAAVKLLFSLLNYQTKPSRVKETKVRQIMSTSNLSDIRPDYDY